MCAPRWAFIVLHFSNNKKNYFNGNFTKCSRTCSVIEIERYFNYRISILKKYYNFLWRFSRESASSAWSFNIFFKQFMILLKIENLTRMLKDSNRNIAIISIPSLMNPRRNWQWNVKVIIIFQARIFLLCNICGNSYLLIISKNCLCFHVMEKSCC